MPGNNVLSYDDMVKMFGEYPETSPEVHVGALDREALIKEFGKLPDNIKENIHILPGQAFAFDPSVLEIPMRQGLSYARK